MLSLCDCFQGVEAELKETQERKERAKARRLSLNSTPQRRMSLGGINQAHSRNRRLSLQPSKITPGRMRSATENNLSQPSTSVSPSTPSEASPSSSSSVTSGRISIVSSSSLNKPSQMEVFKRNEVQVLPL